MRRLLSASLLLLATVSSAADDRKLREADLGKKGSVAVDKSLAGDLTRKKEEKQTAPALKYDQFRLGVEMQVASKRHEQIASLKKIISLGPDPKEHPALLFRLAELYWEESKFFFFESNRKDDDFLNAQDRKDKAGMERAKAEKEELTVQSKDFAKLAIDQYSEIVQRFKDYERNDEVLYFLGHNLMEQGDDRRSLLAYKRLVDKYPKSRYIPDAHLAFGEYYFNNSKGKREMLEKALDAYRKAASFPDSQVYAFALYKQGWCFYNLADYAKAMDMFKTVVLYGELAGASAVEKDGGKSGKSGLVREARTDFVRSYAQIGSPSDARAEFGKVASKPEDRYTMMKQLANLYYEDGKDKEAALTYKTLIKEKPLSPEAPGFQGKIVDCVLRAGNKKMTVEQVRVLVKIMQDVEQSGVIKDEKDKQALADAKGLSERTLSNLAVTWHNEAKKTRDEDTFQLANEVYSDYLVLFSDNPKAYDLRFFWAELLNDNLQKYDKAAEEYTRVVLQDAKKIDGTKDPKTGKVTPGKPGKWLVNAAYNAVLANDEVVKKADAAGQLKVEASADNKKVAIHPVKKALLEACERYLKYVPNGDKKVEIAFKAANIYYRYNHFDEAVLRFSEIALGYPDYKFEDGSRAGEVAANLVLDSYNLLGNWAKVNEWARKFYASEKLAVGAFRDELSRVLEQSSFKLVNQLEANKEFAKAAEAYLTFVSEFPGSQIADQALYNASIDYFNAKMLDKAMKVRAQIIEKYPKSTFVPACIYANAETHETIGDFAAAAQGYEGYVRGYERSLEEKGAPKASKSKKGKQASRGKKGKKDEPEPAAGPKKEQAWEEAKAQIALFNAAVLREGLGELKQALKDREHFLELWPESKDYEAVFLSIVDLHEKMGSYGKALGQLEEYERKYIRDPNKVLAAEGRIAKIFETKNKRPREADRINARILKYYQELPSRVKKALEGGALEAVAHAHYLRNEDDFRFYSILKLRWGRLPSPEVEFKEGLKEKAKRMKVVQDDYTQTVGFKAGDPAICALYKIGLAYDNFNEVLTNAPMPRGAPPELQDAIREQLSEQADPLRKKAAEAFASAVQKGRELEIHNDCAKKSLKLLRETYAPDQFPSMLEDVAELKPVKLPAAGGELLAAVQTVPAYTASQQAENQEKVKALQELPDVAASNGASGLPHDDAPPTRAGPPPAEDLKPAAGAEPAERKPADAAKPAPAPEAEPEDNL